MRILIYTLYLSLYAAMTYGAHCANTQSAYQKERCRALFHSDHIVPAPPPSSTETKHFNRVQYPQKPKKTASHTTKNIPHLAENIPSVNPQTEKNNRTHLSKNAMKTNRNDAHRSNQQLHSTKTAKKQPPSKQPQPIYGSQKTPPKKNSYHFKLY